MISKLPSLSSIDVTPNMEEGDIAILGYNKEGFRLSNGEFIYGNIFISKKLAKKIQNFSFKKDLELLKEDIILIGIDSSDDREKLLELAANNRILQKSIEIMPANAACRTYNILLSEGRNIASIIFLDENYEF